MSKAPPPFELPPPGPVDLQALDEFLLSDRAPDDGMGLSDLDGFLHGIVVGPEPIMPSEWLPVIWDDEEPTFADMDEANKILGAIHGRYNEIIADLESDPDLVHPIYWQDNGGTLIVSDWAAGFLDAINLREAAWQPMFTHRRARTLILPLIGLGADDPDHPPFGFPAFSEKDLAVWQMGAEKMIPMCVSGIQSFWMDWRQRATAATQRPRRPAPRRRR